MLVLDYKTGLYRREKRKSVLGFELSTGGVVVQVHLVLWAFFESIFLYIETIYGNKTCSNRAVRSTTTSTSRITTGCTRDRAGLAI